MTLNEYNEFKKHFYEKELDKYKENIRKFKAKEKDDNLLDYGIKQEISFDSMSYFNTAKDIQSLANNIKEAEQEHSWKKNYQLFLQGSAYCVDMDESEFDDAWFTMSWIEPCDKAFYERKVKQKMLNVLGEKLLPKDRKYQQEPQCVHIQMFENEEITWKGLQKLTYQICDI